MKLGHLKIHLDLHSFRHCVVYCVCPNQNVTLMHTYTPAQKRENKLKNNILRIQKKSDTKGGKQQQGIILRESAYLQVRRKKTLLPSLINI